MLNANINLTGCKTHETRCQSTESLLGMSESQNTILDMHGSLFLNGIFSRSPSAEGKFTCYIEENYFTRKRGDFLSKNQLDIHSTETTSKPSCAVTKLKPIFFV